MLNFLSKLLPKITATVAPTTPLNGATDKANAKYAPALQAMANTPTNPAPVSALPPNVEIGVQQSIAGQYAPEDILPKLKAMCPNGVLNIMSKIAQYAQTMERYGITPGVRRQMFLAQCAEESDGFRTLHEYASGREYEGRHDLGNTVEGDGPRYKGSGLIELTGRANFDKYGKKLGIDLIAHPELARTIPSEGDARFIALETACLFWQDHGLNALADAGMFETITKRINGGLNGYSTRLLYLTRAKKAGL